MSWDETYFSNNSSSNNKTTIYLPVVVLGDRQTDGNDDSSGGGSCGVDGGDSSSGQQQISSYGTSMSCTSTHNEHSESEKLRRRRRFICFLAKYCRRFPIICTLLLLLKTTKWKFVEFFSFELILPNLKSILCLFNSQKNENIDRVIKKISIDSRLS